MLIELFAPTPASAPSSFVESLHEVCQSIAFIIVDIVGLEVCARVCACVGSDLERPADCCI